MNQIIHGDSLEVLKTFADDSVDCVITSPPYDNLRTYISGSDFDFEGIALSLVRVLKPGGVIVWVVGDATIKGSETGTSFRQALFFKELGLNIHDTMIWKKANPVPQDYHTSSRYTNAIEYMFVFSKGKPRTFNPIMEPSKMSGHILKTNTSQRKASGAAREDRRERRKDTIVQPIKPRSNVWEMSCGGHKNHPATFPLKLAQDHILTWSDVGDVVLDPFLGSGTTAVAAKILGRKYIGIERESEYVAIAETRLKSVPGKLF